MGDDGGQADLAEEPPQNQEDEVANPRLARVLVVLLLQKAEQGIHFWIGVANMRDDFVVVGRWLGHGVILLHIHSYREDRKWYEKRPRIVVI